MVLMAGITTYNSFADKSSTNTATQNTAIEGPNGDGDGETNDDSTTSEGPNGDGDGEINDDQIKH